MRRTTISPRAICLFLLVAWLSSVPLAAGQDPAPPHQAPSDRAVNTAQPDFTIVTLPTTLSRLPTCLSTITLSPEVDQLPVWLTTRKWPSYSSAEN